MLGLRERKQREKTNVRCSLFIGVRVSPERDISSLRAFGLGGRQVLRVVRVSARALFDVLGGNCCYYT